MKKLYLFCLILLPLMMVSCKDDSGDFIEQYYTDAELTSALRTCLTTAKDTALNRICVADGLNGNDTYRITLPDNADFRALADILTAQDKSHLTDTLSARLNRACELSGTSLSTAFNDIVSSLTFPDPSSIVYSSNNDAATTYFRTNCGAAILSSATSILSQQIQSAGANSTWAEIQSAYHDATATFFNYDITGFAASSLLNAVYTEMAKEEELIRTDSLHARAGNLSAFRK